MQYSSQVNLVSTGTWDDSVYHRQRCIKRRTQYLTLLFTISAKCLKNNNKQANRQTKPDRCDKRRRIPEKQHDMYEQSDCMQQMNSFDFCILSIVSFNLLIFFRVRLALCIEWACIAAANGCVNVLRSHYTHHTESFLKFWHSTDCWFPLG